MSIKNQNSDMNCTQRLSALLAALLLAVGGTLKAQNTGFTFTGGWSFPIGNYAHSDLQRSQWGLANKCPDGGAGQGGLLGVQWSSAIGSMEGFSWMVSIDLIFSDLNSDIKTSTFEVRRVMESNFSEVSFTLPYYYNLPLMAGLRREWTLSNGQGIFVEAQVGLDYCIISDRSVSLRGGAEPLVIAGNRFYDYDYTDRFNNTLSAAFRLGVGYRFAERWQAEVALWYLGTHLISGTEEVAFKTDPSYTSMTEAKQDFMLSEIAPMLIAARIGFRL